MMRFASFAAVAAVAQLDTNGSMYVDALKLTGVHTYQEDLSAGVDHLHTYHWVKTDKYLEGSELTVNDFVKGGRFEFFGLKSEDDLSNGYRPLYAEITDEPDIDGFFSIVRRIFELKGRFVQRHNKRYSAVDGETLLLLTNNAWHSKLCVVVGEWTYHGENMLNMVRTRNVAGEEESQNLLEL